MFLTEIEAAVEAVLFAYGESTPITLIAAAINCSEETARTAIYTLMAKYNEEKRGIKIIEINNSFQMCTNSDYYDYVSHIFQNTQKRQLSQTLIETLAIIAYKQPVTKGQIEEIRGVDAGHAVNRLVEFGLVCEKGRLDAPGRPILFGTTDDFLKYYGFKAVSDLPDLPECEEENERELNTLKFEICESEKEYKE